MAVDHDVDRHHDAAEVGQPWQHNTGAMGIKVLRIDEGDPVVDRTRRDAVEDRRPEPLGRY